MMNKSSQNNKFKLNMITKESFKKQIIISTRSNNMERVIVQSNMYITNINKLFKSIKLDILTDFICTNNKEIIITMNRIAA